VDAQRLHDEASERNGPVARRGLRWREDRHVEVAVDELPIDAQRATQEVDPVDRESARLTSIDGIDVLKASRALRVGAETTTVGIPSRPITLAAFVELYEAELRAFAASGMGSAPRVLDAFEAGEIR
jgi:hypothetical protein